MIGIREGGKEEEGKVDFIFVVAALAAIARKGGRDRDVGKIEEVWVEESL